MATDPFLEALADTLDEDDGRPNLWRGAVQWGQPYERVLSAAQLRDPTARPPAFQDGRARPEQLLPGTPGAAGANNAATGQPIMSAEEWVYWLVRSGRGWGKTETGAQAIIEWAKAGFSPLLMAGRTAADVRDTMVEVGPSALLRLCPQDFQAHYEPSKRRITFPNGVECQLRSADEPDGFRGVQFVRAWLDELAAWKYLDECWDQIQLVMRVKSKRGRVQVVITTTPKPAKVIRRLSGSGKFRSDRLAARCALTVRPSDDNLGNLADDFVETIEEMRHSRLGQQEVEGMILEDVEGALWKQQNIDDDRVTLEDFRRRVTEGELTLIGAVVGVDPPGGRTECGIVAASKGGDKHGYVLDDASLPGGPDVWVPAVLRTYRAPAGETDWACDKVVAEVNYGGDMVPHVIEAEGEKRVPVTIVRATRGKAVRAEPVAGLYRRHLVHHVGYFPELEREQTEWVPDEGQPSPNRMDALVWAMTELFGLYDRKEEKPKMPRGAETLVPLAVGTGGWKEAEKGGPILSPWGGAGAGGGKRKR